MIASPSVHTPYPTVPTASRISGTVTSEVATTAPALATLAATLRLRAGRIAQAYGRRRRVYDGARSVADALPTRFRLRAGNLDTALRYEMVLRLLAERWRPGMRVLEVGSGSGGVAEYLSYPVTGVDPAFERTAE